MQTIEQALNATTLYTDGKSYLLVRLPPSAITLAASLVAELAEPFSSVIVDKDEVTLLITAEAVADFTARFRDYRVSDGTYRLITFGVALDLALVGFMARVAQALADAGVPILPYAAFTRDHLLVPADKFDNAWAALEKLTAET